MDSRVEEIRSIVMCDGNIIRDLTKDEAIYLLEALDRAKAENEAFRRFLRLYRNALPGFLHAIDDEMDLAWVEVERIMGDE